MTIIPVPLAALDGRTYVEHDGALWELTPWLPGEPVAPGAATEGEVSAALAALATFHRAAATFPQDEPRHGPAPTIAIRLESIHYWLHRGGAERIAMRLENFGLPTLGQVTLLPRETRRLDDRGSPHKEPVASEQLVEHGRVVVDAFRRLAPDIEQELSLLRDLHVPLQPCIRDIHDRHVLFTTGRVTGLIDFGAMRVNNVATDVARLLGTMARDDGTLRSAGLAAYRQVRPLEDAEARLAAAIDRANVALTGMQWLEWLLVDGKQFSSLSHVIERIKMVRGRLANFRAGVTPDQQNP
jgi:homoserine kinase type II